MHADSGLSVFLIACALLTITGTAPSSVFSGSGDWTWVLGRLPDERANAEYEAFARRMFDSYQGRGQLSGELVYEADLDAMPESQVVFLGPLGAFEHTDWMMPPLDEARRASFRIGEQTFAEPGTGLFLTDIARSRYLYTGTTLQGFRDLFSVFTGQHACTITVGGQTRWEGEWSDGELKLRLLPFLPLYPTAEEVAEFGDVSKSMPSIPVYETPRHEVLAEEFELRIDKLVKDRENPDSPVHVASLDMEWGMDAVVTRILTPYFKELDPEIHIPNPHQVSNEVWAESLEHMSRLLEWAEANAVEGAYPFQTPGYFRNVLTSLSDTPALKDFSVDRQRAIARNISEFNGELFGDGLVLFKGGGFHAVKTRGRDRGFQRDAAFLDLNSRMGSATNYNNFVRGFQKALAGGYASEEDFYLFEGDELELSERLAIRAGYVTERSILWIDSIDLPAAGGEAGSHPLMDYDGLVYVLRSKLERTRARVFGKD